MAKIYNELSNYKNVPLELVFDKELSDRARFVYVFMACKPKDWDFYLEPMAREIGYSVDTLRKYINELTESGWVEKGEQQTEKGKFGAVEYTIKANNILPHTENTVSEILRVGKNPTQHNKDNINKRDIIYNKDKIEKEYKEKFKSFVSLYKKMGGKSRGIDTEFNDFTKRHKDWEKVLPYLELAVQREIKQRQQAKSEKKFFPEPKMLQTYLGKQRAWEYYVTIGEDITKEEYTPVCEGSLSWNDYLKCYLYVGFWDGKFMPDGYTDDNRPNGASVMLNNGRGTIVWDKSLKKWENK